eukprot:scaffold32909_cov63-Phaeocystis_antarctica.AAC.1
MPGQSQHATVNDIPSWARLAPATALAFQKHLDEEKLLADERLRAEERLTEENTHRVLDSLAASSERVSLPVQQHAQRLGSGHRGLSRPAFRSLRAFFDKHGALDKMMGDVCKEEGLPVSVCELTKSTGLLLAESLALAADGHFLLLLLVDGHQARGHARRARADPGTARGERWSDALRLGTPTRHREPRSPHPTTAATAAPALPPHRAPRPSARQVDMFCASQNLLAGEYRDPAVTKESDPQGYLARKEDTDRIFDDALDAVDETFVYFEPLAGEWRAPPHPFLVAEQGKPAEVWVRRGPAALTRAWCIFELAKSLYKGCKLYVLLGEKSVEQFEEKLLYDENGFRWIADILGRVDVKQAQITKAEDREYILGEVGKLPGGMGAVNSSVIEALGGWVIGEAQAMLEAVPEAERGMSTLLSNVAAMLKNRGRLVEAEALQLVDLKAYRAKLGDRAPGTLVALNNLATNLREQDRFDLAEPFFREAMATGREVSGNDDKNTMRAVGNLGKVLLEQGKLEEADPLLVEAVAWFRKNNDGFGHFCNGPLVELRREQGRLSEAQQELGTLVADMSRLWGPQHRSTLEAEAIAARLRHAQPDGAAAGAAELRAVVGKMSEFLGAAHQYTVEWQRVLEG